MFLSYDCCFTEWNGYIETNRQTAHSCTSIVGVGRVVDDSREDIDEEKKHSDKESSPEEEDDDEEAEEEKDYLPGWVGGGGEEEEYPGCYNDEAGGDVVQEHFLKTK